MITEIIFDAQIEWTFLSGGEVQITDITPLCFEKKEPQKIDLSLLQSKILLLILEKCGVLQNIVEDIESKNNYQEQLKEAYFDRLESESMENLF